MTSVPVLRHRSRWSAAQERRPTTSASRIKPVLLVDEAQEEEAGGLARATPLPTVKDWQKAFDWPAEDENFAVWARCKAIKMSSTCATRPINSWRGTSSKESRS